MLIVKYSNYIGFGFLTPSVSTFLLVEFRDDQSCTFGIRENRKLSYVPKEFFEIFQLSEIYAPKTFPSVLLMIRIVGLISEAVATILAKLYPSTPYKSTKFHNRATCVEFPDWIHNSESVWKK